MRSPKQMTPLEAIGITALMIAWFFLYWIGAATFLWIVVVGCSEVKGGGWLEFDCGSSRPSILWGKEAFWNGGSFCIGVSWKGQNCVRNSSSTLLASGDLTSPTNKRKSPLRLREACGTRVATPNRLDSSRTARSTTQPRLLAGEYLDYPATSSLSPTFSK